MHQQVSTPPCTYFYSTIAIQMQMPNSFQFQFILLFSSLALLTASKFGLSDSIIKRAEELSEHWNVERDGDFGEGVSAHTSNANSILHATTILEETVGKGSSILIPPSYMSPPSLEGTSVVYILQIGDEESKMRYYVGETDSLSQRLSQHRSKGKEWSSLSAVAIKNDGGKSKSRNIESLVIQQMAKRGYNLISIADGTSIRSTRRTN